MGQSPYQASFFDLDISSRFSRKSLPSNRIWLWARAFAPGRFAPFQICSSIIKHREKKEGPDVSADSDNKYNSIRKKFD